MKKAPARMERTQNRIRKKAIIPKGISGKLTDILPSTMEKLTNAGLICQFEDRTELYKFFKEQLDSKAMHNATLQLLQQYGVLPCTLQDSDQMKKFLILFELLSSTVVQQYLNTWDEINKSNNDPDLSAITNTESQYSDNDIDNITKQINDTKGEIEALGNIKDQRNTLGDKLKTTNGKDTINDFLEVANIIQTNEQLNQKLTNKKQEREEIFTNRYGSELNYKLATMMSTFGINITTQEPEYPEKTDIKETTDEAKKAKIEKFFERYDSNTQDILNTPHKIYIRDTPVQQTPKEKIIAHLDAHGNSELKDLLDNQHDEYFFALIDLIVQRYLANINDDYKNIDNALFAYNGRISPKIIEAIKHDKIPLNYFKTFLQFISNYSNTENYDYLYWYGEPEEIAHFNFTPETLQTFRAIQNIFGDLGYDIQKQFKQQYDASYFFKNIFEPEV